MLLGLDIGAVRHRGLAVPHLHDRRRFRPLHGIGRDQMTAALQFLVVRERFPLLLAVLLGRERADELIVDVDETEIVHGFLQKG